MPSYASQLLNLIKSCNNAAPERTHIPLYVQGQHTGWVSPALLPALEQNNLSPRGGMLHVHSSKELEELSATLAQRGVYRPHHELFDVITAPDAPAIARIDRGAVPLFGVIAQGVHMNGLVEKQNRLHLWVARRTATKRLDPAKLDHIAAGGVPAGYTPEEALYKEAMEEAGIPAELCRTASQAGTISYMMERPEGLRRDILHCYDLFLPESFIPTPWDGEVDAFQLLPLDEVFDIVTRTDQFKFNVNLVLIDLFLRHGLLSSQPPALQDTLRAGLRRF